MSAGVFVNSKYSATLDNGGGIYPIKIQPETLNLVIDTSGNDAPIGPVDQYVSAQAGGSTKKYGMHASMVYLRFGTPPTGYKAGGIVSIPLLNATIRGKAKKGATGTYLGQTVTVVGKRAEVAR
jgi:hypothetical protein